MVLRVLDTFAGAGGFSLGFEQASCEVVGAIETDQWATDTFKHNHPDSIVVKKSIEDLTNKQLEKHYSNSAPDIVLGGPPCQGFSICNKHNGDPKDPRNSLFEEFLRVGKVFRPKVMIMENVPNLIKARTADKRLVVDIIQEELSELGYHVYVKLLEAVDFGVPQIRKRLVMIGSKRPLEKPFPDATHAPESGTRDMFAESLLATPTLWDAISDMPDIEARGGAEVMDYDSAPKTPYQIAMRENCRDRLHNHRAMKHSARLVERFAAMSCGDTVNDLPRHLMPVKRNSNGVITGKAYDQSNRRMHPDRQCHTVPASFYANFVHPFKNRNFTAREGARIQSFPDHYVFLGKPTVVSQKLLQREERFDEKYLCQYNQIGNAVPPLMAQAIAENILKQYQEPGELKNVRAR